MKIILLLLLLLLVGLSMPKSKKLTFIIIIFFFLLASLRSNIIGNDTQNYLDVFKWISNNGYQMIENLSYRFEKGFLVYTFVLTKISNNPQLFLIVSAFFTYFVYYIFIKRYSMYPLFATTLMVFLRFFDEPMNTIRFSIAAALTVIALQCLIRNKLWCFYILIVLSSTFHRTTLIFAVVILLWNKKINLKKIITYICSAVLVTLLFKNVLSLLLNIFPIYNYYVGTEYLDGQVRLASILILLLNSIIYIISFYEFEANKSNFICVGMDKSLINITENLLNISFIGILIMIVSFNFNLLNRVSDLFLFYLPIAFSNVLYLKKDKYNKFILMTVIGIACLFYYIIILIYRPDWNKIFPYYFFWEN